MKYKAFVAYGEMPHDAISDLEDAVNNFITESAKMGETWIATGGIALAPANEGTQFSCAQALVAIDTRPIVIPRPPQTLYSFFYPGTNAQINLVQNWATVDEALAWWDENHSPDIWPKLEIKTEEAAWMNRRTGTIVVLRETP